MCDCSMQLAFTFIRRCPALMFFSGLWIMMFLSSIITLSVVSYGHILLKMTMEKTIFCSKNEYKTSVNSSLKL